MIHGPRTKFADEGLAMTFTYFRITRDFELANLISSQETKRLYSGKISVTWIGG